MIRYYQLDGLPIKFFKTSQNKEPVREWLKSLDKDERKVIGEDMRTLQFGWPLGMPLVRSLGEGLWELRSLLKERTARLIFYIDRGDVILLHAFIKKAQKTPQQDLLLAKKRKSQHMMK